MRPEYRDRASAAISRASRTAPPTGLTWYDCRWREMPQAAVHPRETLTFAYLCDVLDRAGMLTADQRREAIAKADTMHARILRLRATGPRKRGSTPGGDGVHPVEVLVAMGLGQGGDPRFPLSERVVMQAL